jgi:cobyrinic acid a,c-diamide synthase
LRETGRGPWALRREGEQLAEFPAHEFHYSRLENIDPKLDFAYEVRRGVGCDGAHDGIIYKNLLAGYAHLRDVEDNRWTQRFVDFVRKCGAGSRSVIQSGKS